jgi:hypothetical protein
LSENQVERALQTAMKDRERVAQLTAMLDEDGWAEAAKFASYDHQCAALNLKPWERPPCHDYWLDGDRVVRDEKGGDLADELTAAGLSVWEPDPQRALAKARQRRTRSKRSGRGRR